MTKQEFYEELNTAITVGCQLPFSIPEKALDNIVKFAHSWFTRNWDDGVENIYLSIPKSSWSNNEEFSATRKITLPNCIYSVNAVAKDTYSKNTMTAYSDFSVGSYLGSNIGVGGGGIGVGDGTMSDAVLGYVVAASWGDMADHIFNYPISYNFNRQTSKLFLKGSLQESPDFLLDCDVQTPIEAMYELDLFFDYCLGHAKMQLANILGTFSMNLPGNATINYDRYYDQGKDQVTEVKEEVKNMNSGSSFFLHTNGL
tara:strand:+ start:235 stop:1005 length:771 start_codon:yes stop_codon:yes gene_type:complete